MREPKTRSPRTKRWIGLTAATLAGAAASILLIDLIPAVRTGVGPATITAKGVMGLGRTKLLIPPLGAVEARTHPGPLTVSLSLAEVDLPALIDAFEEPEGRLGLTSTIEQDLRAMAVGLTVRLLIGAAIVGVVALALLPRRRWRYVAAGGIGGTAAMGTLVAITATGFSVDAFEEPRFTGALTRAPVVIEALESNELSIPDVRSRFESAADRLTGLLALLAEPDVDPRHDSTAVLHISDVHSNPVGLQIARQLARQFEVDAVLDTGDLTNFGVAVETRIADLVDDFDVPYIFVPGNHDSQRVVLRMQSLENVTVLDGGLTEVAGVRILGFRDPTYTNWNRLPPDEAALIKLNAAGTVADRTLQAQPDILAVHDRRMATGAHGLVPLILSGHYHKQIVEEERGTRSLVVGTTGASGLKSFTVDADQNYEAQIVYLRDGVAVAFDYIRFEGLGANFVIERTTLDDLGPLEPPPGVSPSPSGTANPPE